MARGTIAPVVIQWLARGMGDVPSSGEWLAPAESARLAGLRFPKRRSELRLSRWTAKLALAAALGLDDDAGALAGIEIRPAEMGAPIAFVREQPAPVAVSLTGRADWAVCVVAPSGLAVGCDLELVEPRTDRFARDWLTPAEQDLVSGAASGDEEQVLANLVWSAKESALKALRTGLRRSTRSVEVEVVDRAGHRRWARFGVRAEEGLSFHGWWRRYGDFLLTCAAGADCDPPVSIEDPPRLTGAMPSHSWLS